MAAAARVPVLPHWRATSRDGQSPDRRPYRQLVHQGRLQPAAAPKSWLSQALSQGRLQRTRRKHPQVPELSRSQHASQVRLWYSKLDYGIQLGQLVSVWTSFVAARDPTTSSLLSAHHRFVTAFPEVDSSCYFAVLDESLHPGLHRLPLGYRHDQALQSLMTLRAFVEGGHEVASAKVLLCVKSVGQQRRCESTHPAQRRGLTPPARQAP